MNFNLSPTTGFPNLYNTLNHTIGRDNPMILIILTVIIILYYLLFSSLGTTTSNVDIQPKSSGMSIIEVILWGLFVFLILINGLQYFFDVNINTAIKNIFSPVPEIDITITQDEDDSEPVPEIMYEKQVFNIPNNTYTYNDADALCKAYGSRLATYNEIEKAYNDGAEWCGYGWSDKQLALYPTQKHTYDKLQKIKGHEHDCGRPGINGGYIANPNVKFGVNCYGYKPEITEQEREIMADVNPYPITKKDKELEQKVNYYKSKLPDILVAPFSTHKWSQI